MADEAGVDRVVVVDHVVLGRTTGEYTGGTFPTGPAGAWLEPLTLLGVLAGMTTRVRLVTSVLVAPLRRPVVLAKSLATLDVLSNGRLDAGVGVGWQRAEYVAAGIDFEARGRLLDETLGVCRALWSNSPATYQSDTLSFEDIWCEPKPLQPGGVPIWLGGTLNAPNTARLVTYGSGWMPWGDHRRDLPRAASMLRGILERAGRDPESVVVQGTIPVLESSPGRLDLGAMVREVPKLVRAGIADFVVRLPPAPDPATDLATTRELVARFREAVDATP
jgi:probable F420-dependent oxidoreductase